MGRHVDYGSRGSRVASHGSGKGRERRWLPKHDFRILTNECGNVCVTHVEKASCSRFIASSQTLLTRSDAYFEGQALNKFV